MKKQNKIMRLLKLSKQKKITNQATHNNMSTAMCPTYFGEEVAKDRKVTKIEKKKGWGR